MNLYNKYRPQNFEEMVGNKIVIESLKSVIKRKDRPHVYLFSGDRGCGKTTLARICAKEIGASDYGITEINTSNNRGIDTARKIIDDMKFLPVDGLPRVFIIDEVHKTTNDWQNSMLKPLEDVNEFSYFFLCTTNPEKLIKPLKSRCMEFKVKPLKEKEIVYLLKSVAKKENIIKSKEVYLTIAEKSRGNPREALILLEKVKDLDNEDALDVLEEDSLYLSKDVLDLCRLLIKRKDKSWKEIADTLKEVLKNKEPMEVKLAVIGYMKKVLLSGKNNRQAGEVLDVFLNLLDQTTDVESSLVLSCYLSFISG